MCKFYGRSSLRKIGELVNTHGNQCALIYEAHSPCRMEIEGHAPDFQVCELNGSARANECAEFVVIGEEPAFQ